MRRSAMHPEAWPGRTTQVALAAALVLLAGCEGTDSLSAKGCLPLTVPTRVTLLQPAGLFAIREEKTLFLMDLPRSTVNDGFNGVRQVRVLPAGTVLELRELSQRWGFDSGKGRISAFGRTPQGEAFEYGWGAATTLGRAPWEPASVPRTRTVDCGN